MIVNQQHYRTIWPNFTNGQLDFVSIIDQTALPHAFVICHVTTLAEMVKAIKTMQVRGAPLIGAAAAYGFALAAKHAVSEQYLLECGHQLKDSRPTAINLAWAIDRMLSVVLSVDASKRLEKAYAEAAIICDEDVAINQRIAQYGLNVIQSRYDTLNLNGSASKPIQILTHCNAGWLATVDIGTALAPIYAAHDAGINVHVWVDETRPRNQGASLTAWELGQHGVAHTVISDNAGGHLMQQGEVDLVIVGADRVTSKGDVCNKIGTYLKALAAHDNQVPFYVAVPSPTIDWAIENAHDEIPIELRHGDEVSWMQGINASGEMHRVRVVPAFSNTLNPAFDITPARLVTGIITDQGLFAPADLNEVK